MAIQQCRLLDISELHGNLRPPLVEAASYGLKIFVSDLPYAREVLKGYNWSFFCKIYSIEEWVRTNTKRIEYK